MAHVTRWYSSLQPASSLSGTQIRGARRACKVVPVPVDLCRVQESAQANGACTYDGHLHLRQGGGLFCEPFPACRSYTSRPAVATSALVAATLHAVDGPASQPTAAYAHEL